MAFRSLTVLVVLLAQLEFLRYASAGVSNKAYVGNLSWSTTDETLRAAFEPYGTVLDAIVMKDRGTGRSRGFGFVTFSSEDEVRAAIAGLNDQELDGRRIRVNLANSRGSGGGRSYGTGY